LTSRTGGIILALSALYTSGEVKRLMTAVPSQRG
jgi:hypothetical protein